MPFLTQEIKTSVFKRPLAGPAEGEGQGGFSLPPPPPTFLEILKSY